MGFTRRNLLQSLSTLAGASVLPLTSQSKPSSAKNEFNGSADVSDIINLYDFERMAEGIMKKMAFEYFSSGAADEFTVRWIREALDKIKIQPQVLNDVSKLDTKVHVDIILLIGS